MSSFCWVPASHICLPLCSSAAAVMSLATSGQLISAMWFILQSPAGSNKEKNPKSHKSIKGNNSKQREGNDPGLLLLKGGGETCTRMLLFSLLSKTHFPTCHWSAHLGVAGALAKQNQGRSLIKQVIPCCDNARPRFQVRLCFHPAPITIYATLAPVSRTGSHPPLNE